MSIIADDATARKYADYATRVLDDSTKRAVIYDEVDGRLARFHCAVYRVPSRREFTLRHHAGASAEDREKAERALERMPAGYWAAFPASRWFKHRAKDGHYYWVMEFGRYVDDPLVQLELEMMIDLCRERQDAV